MTFNQTTEDWRPLITANAADVPVEYLLAWVQRESNGSPCSWTSLSEAGIFQLEPPDNITQGGTSIAAIHPSPPCTVGVQTTKWFADLSSDQQDEQVRSGLQYINYVRGRVHQLLSQYGGQDWDENQDFWTMVKMYHNLPGVIPPGLTAAQTALGRPPATWQEFRDNVSSNYKKWLDYAEWIGSFVGSGPDFYLDAENIIIDQTDPITTPPGAPSASLSWLEIGIVGLAGLAGFYAAIRFDRWLGHGKAG